MKYSHSLPSFAERLWRPAVFIVLFAFALLLASVVWAASSKADLQSKMLQLDTTHSTQGAEYTEMRDLINLYDGDTTGVLSALSSVESMHSDLKNALVSLRSAIDALPDDPAPPPGQPNIFSRNNYVLTFQTEIIDERGLSGLTYNTRTQTLFALDENAELLELDANANVLRRITLENKAIRDSGGSPVGGRDFEAVEYMRSEGTTDIFALVDEERITSINYNGALLIIRVDATDTTIDLENPADTEVYPFVIGKGGESVGYDPLADNNVFHMIQGKDYLRVRYDPVAKTITEELNPYFPWANMPSTWRYPVRDVELNSAITPDLIILNAQGHNKLAEVDYLGNYATVPERIRSFRDINSEVPLEFPSGTWRKCEGVAFTSELEFFVVCETKAGIDNFYRFNAQ